MFQYYTPTDCVNTAPLNVEYYSAKIQIDWEPVDGDKMSVDLINTGQIIV